MNLDDIVTFSYEEKDHIIQMRYIRGAEFEYIVLHWWRDKNGRGYCKIRRYKDYRLALGAYYRAVGDRLI